MSEIRFYINDFRVDMYDGQKIGYTKQVNSLKNLSSRQTNFSKSFKVPATPKNVKNFEGLGMTGTNSNMPYQKNTAMLFVGNLCLIAKGWTIYRGKKGNDFDINIYDGNIDFFKELDNVKFEDVDIPELSHIKNIEEIKSNWENGNDYYKYLLADYNGKTHFEIGLNKYINTDYLIPSVKTSFLWEKIFQTFGFTFSGAIFDTQAYKDLFLTYPKGVISGQSGDVFADIEVNISNFVGFERSKVHPMTLNENYDDYTDAVTVETSIDQGSYNICPWDSNQVYSYYQVPENGYYKIRVTGSLDTNILGFQKAIVLLGKNKHQQEQTQIANLYSIFQTDEANLHQIDWENMTDQYYNAGDTIMIFWFYNSSSSFSVSSPKNYNIKLEVSKINQTEIDQTSFFKGLTPKDFYREIMWRFGLTPFPSKDSNHLDFLTYDERINGDVEDWSDFYIGSEEEDSEEYILGDYAKRNYFRFKYNGEEQDFNDGYFDIENENLDDNINVITSKTYSPNEFPVPFLIGNQNEDIPVLELWEKEVKQEDGETVIEYKARDSRFSFVKERVLNTAVNIGSEQLGETNSATKLRVVDNADYSFQKLKEEYYSPMDVLFNRVLLITTKFKLNISKFDSFDLKKRIYVKQKGGEFLVDKMKKSHLTDDITECKLIKINR
ncbi:hypothetical protein [Mesonia aestuariivivens]|uniref:Uncharacterized protein n=1 Tax=Mesonia aestuariivivens TaxID=2796128 RepID=A0ABS6W0A9_9FLAO|nr:hypothetical protein [Mesonia aestuariivivens]MBW2961278.1 hypothetical protein [Mesonia aestuariivivens]